MAVEMSTLTNLNPLIMVHYPYQRILRACPDGTITRLNARTMSAIAGEARADASGKPAIEAAKILMGAGRECMANGYQETARGLYIEAINRIAGHARDSYSHAGRDLHYACAVILDRIERRVYGPQPGPSHLIVAKEFYMALSLDYEYVVLNYDNYERFRQYRQFCRRHGLDNL